MAVRAPLEKVLALCDPRTQWLWDCSAPTASELQALLTNAPEVDHPITDHGTAEQHIGRVRYLAARGWEDAIQIDVGVPVLGYAGPSWPVLDGNHRLWAAALRADATIAVEIEGQIDHAAELLGLPEAVF